MSKTKTRKVSRETSKAEHCHSYDLMPPGDTGNTKVSLYSAQDRDGQWYASAAIAWKKPSALPARESKLVPATAPKFATEEQALQAAALEGIEWVDSLPGGKSLQRSKVCEALQRVATGQTTCSPHDSHCEPEPDLATAHREEADKIDLTGFDPSHLTWGRVRVVVQWPLEKIVRHPLNRPVDAEHVAKLATSFATEGGQWEPIIVRVPPRRWLVGPSAIPEGFVQLISGEHRWEAAKAAGWEAIDAIVRADVDDVEALRILAARNARGKPLDDVQRAKLIVELRAAGIEWEACAEAVGLESRTAAINLSHIASAPAVWQARLASQEKPIYQATVREIAKLAAKVPRAVEELEEEWQSDWWPEERDRQTRTVRDVANNATRSMAIANRKALREKWHITNCHDVLFELTDTVRVQLSVVELDGNDRATNIELWDSLQSDAKKALLEKKLAKSAKTEGDSKRELTAEEREALRQRQAEQLQSRIDRWRYNWLRSLVAERLATEPPESEVFARLSPLLAMAPFGTMSYSHFRLHEAIGLAFEDFFRDYEQAWLRINRSDPRIAFRDIVTAMLRAEPRNDEYPDVPLWLVDSLVELLKIDLPAEWIRLQDAGHLSGYLDQYVIAYQLDELGAEWKVRGLVGSKADKAKQLLGRVEPGNTFRYPLPKAIRGKRKGKSS